MERVAGFWLGSPARAALLACGLGLGSALLLGSATADHAGDAALQQDGAILRISEEMVEAALALLDTVQGQPSNIETAVGYNRAELLSLGYGDDARTNYVYWPHLRKGLPLEFMSAQQKALTHDLLNTALSAQGYLSAVHIMQLEQILAGDEVTGFPRGSENYTLAIFGEPSVDGLWGWRFEGHHLSLNFTVAPGEISVTPTFLGASPAEQTSGPLAGFRVLRPMHEQGRALVNALNAEQRDQAVLAEEPPFDILSGTLNRPREQWDDWRDLPGTGLPLAELDDAQKAVAQRVVDEVIGTYRPEISRAYLAQIDLDALRFTWIGSTDDGAPHYYRLDGPDFFFEYDLVQGNGNHVHTVWRSKAGDFGADLLMQHRMEQEH